MFFAVWEKKKIKIFVCVLLVIIISLLVFNIPAIGYVFSKNKRELPIYRVKREDKKISISFDCAWGVDYTDKLLSIMSSEDIMCTFF